MGTKTSKALRARRRETTSQIDRLVTGADQKRSIGLTRRARTQELARVARRRIRALIAARQSAAAIEVEIGQTLLALVDHDLTYSEVFELVGISRHHGRRFIDVARAPQAPPGADSSTTAPEERGLVPTPTDRDSIGGRPGAVPERRA